MIGVHSVLLAQKFQIQHVTLQTDTADCREGSTEHELQ